MIQKFLAAGLVFFFGLIHILGVRRGTVEQNALTLLKLLIVFSLIIFGVACIDWSLTGRLTADYTRGQSKGIADYGLILLNIMFAYSGWNASAYIAGEIRDPQKNLPRAMFLGTLLITIIYIVLNVVFIMSSPFAELAGTHATAAVAAGNLFGKGSSSLLTLGIAIVLISSVSAQMMVGPRVYYAMAKDGIIFSWLARINPRFQTPDLAIMIQMIIAIIYVFVGMNNVNMLLGYIGFSLSIFPLMSVIGLIIMRLRAPEAFRPFRVPLFPIVPLVYIILTVGMMTASLLKWTKTSLTALAVLGVGVIIFFIWRAIHGAKLKALSK
jgi:APA family basic amino acid/polyamine antiporter